MAELAESVMRRPGIGVARRSGFRGIGSGAPASAAPSGLAGPAIYIIAGQSNAMGRSAAFTTPPALPRADVRCSIYVDGVIDGSAPRDLDEFTWRGAEVGLGVTLADAGRNVAISKWVWNATGIQNNWTPWQGDASAVASSALLSDAIVQTRVFIEALITEDPTREPYVAGFYWNQWETDATGAQTAIYDDFLRVVISRVRAEFHPDLPVFIAQVSNNFAGDVGTYPTANVDNIKGAHTALAAESALNVLISEDDLIFDDLIHITSDSQLILGAERLAPAVLAAPVPDYASAALTRVTLYTSRALAEAAGTALASPVDNRVWAVADPAGPHYVPTALWPVADETKAARFFPNPMVFEANNPVGGSIADADCTTAFKTGRWHVRIIPGFVSTSETATRRLFHKSTAYSVYWLGSTKQFNVRCNSVDALCTATTFNGTTDEFVIDVDAAGDQVSFYKNGTLINTAAQANDFGGSAAVVAIGGTTAFATTSQWVGTLYEPVEGAYTP